MIAKKTPAKPVKSAAKPAAKSAAGRVAKPVAKAAAKSAGKAASKSVAKSAKGASAGAAKAISPPQRAPGATLFLFGAKGDLVKRLLMPALYHLTRDGLLGDDIHIVGVDHNVMTDREFRDSLIDFIRTQAASGKSEAGREHIDTKRWASLAKRITYLQGDFLDDSTYRDIGDVLKQRGGNAVFYMATAPRFFGDVAQRLGAAGLLKEEAGAFRRMIVEKPFGHDLASAQQLNVRLLQTMNEEQIYRIDHFLGKETVQNILVSRFANGLFEAVWNNHYIDHIQITAAETVGVEQRGNFYDHTGALRDMVPNHLLQLLAMIAMEPPAAFGADAVRAEKAKVIGAIRPYTPAQARAASVRGQYARGSMNGNKVNGYLQEADIARGSETETYVALKLMIDNWRWTGVPFYLRTGKRMSVRDTEIAICFKRAPVALFRDTEEEPSANYLTMQIQPDEGMWFDFQAKRPGQKMELANVKMGFSYDSYFKMQAATGYETLVYDCLLGDQTLFQRADNVENGWRAVQPFLDAWKRGGKLATYAAGSDGPEESDAMLKRDGIKWHKLG